MKNKQISVVVPLKNLEENTPLWIKFLSEQDADMEILCVTDTLPDGMKEKLQTLGDRVRVLQAEGASCGFLCNLGMDEACGEYVAFLNAGDAPRKGMYSELHRLAVRQKLDFVQGNTEKGKQRDRSFCGYVLHPSEEEHWWRMLRPIGSGIYRLEFLKKNRIRFCETTLGSGIPAEAFLYQVYLHADRAYFMQEACFDAAVLSGNSIGDRGENLLQDYKFLQARMKEDAVLKEKFGTVLVKTAWKDIHETLRELPSLQKAEFARQAAEYLRELHRQGCIDYYALEEDEHRQIIRLMTDTEAFIETLLLDATPRMGMEFLFPYHLFPEGSRIVLYGAGNVGRQFYRQAKHDGYVEIVGIIDRDGGRQALPDIPVKAVEAVKDMEYDYVLLAIREKAAAEEAQKSLEKIGVPACAICWDGQVYFRDEFYRNFYFPVMRAWEGECKDHGSFLHAFQRKMEASDFDHVLPYHLFPYGAKVAIYGGSEVGKKFYRQAIRDGYLKVVGIVDRNIRNMKPSNVPVKPLDALPYMGYDYVLIAIRNAKGAAVAKEVLLKEGVPASAICWDGGVYLRDAFYQKMYLPMMEGWNGNRLQHEKFIKEFHQKINGSIYDHAFPYHLFEPGARVVLYGAGDVGQKFYLQAKQSHYVDIVGIVANHAESLRLPDIPVEPVESLGEMEYDYVLICIRNKEGAEAVQEKLMEQGVAETAIKWDGGMYLQRDFYSKIYLKILKSWGNYGRSYPKMVTGVEKKIKILPQEYVFPYHLFREGERVAIYGASSMGIAFYHHAKELTYVNVVVVIDPKIKRICEAEIPVAPVESIRQFRFDSVLIALVEEKEVCEAKECLLHMGISLDQIKWDGNMYKKDFYEKVYFDYLRRISKIGLSKL